MAAGDMRATSILIAGLACVALVGCMFRSTGVVPMGQGNYMVAKTSAGGGFVSADGTKAKLFKQANAFCAEQNKQLVTTKVSAEDGRLFVRSAHAEIQFRCEAAPADE
jgi:hypothetical protein